jgi:hypothetical protein
MAVNISYCELAQPRCVDVVVAAARFKPNAAGSFELASLRAVKDRQLLKADAAYLAERILIAVTPLHVFAFALGPISWARRNGIAWSRSELVVRSTPVKGDATTASAFLMTDRTGCPRLELASLSDDPDTMRVLDLLPVSDMHDATRR